MDRVPRLRISGGEGNDEFSDLSANLQNYWLISANISYLINYNNVA